MIIRVGVAVDVVSVLIAEGQNLSPTRYEIFLLSVTFRLILGPNLPCIQWILKSSFPSDKAAVIKVTTHLHLVPRSRMAKQYLHSPCFMVQCLTKHRDFIF